MNLANKLTLTRLFLAPLFVLAVIYRNHGNFLMTHLPLFIFSCAVATDVLDGFIARRYGQMTKLGGILDPLADKFLLLTSFVTLTFSHSVSPLFRIPAWVVIVVITRDIFIVTGSSIINMVFGYMEFKPTSLGRVTTFFQMLTVFCVLLMCRLSSLVWTCAGALTVISGVHYLLRANSLIAKRINELQQAEKGSR